MPATSLKLITLLQTLISSQTCRAIRALSRAKSFLLKFLRDRHPVRHLIYCGTRGKRTHHGHAAYFGSFRFHYNWCSSRSFTIPDPALDGLRPNYLQYDAATWNIVDMEDRAGEDNGLAGLSGYLRWLEERKSDDGGKSSSSIGGISEIDEMADVFIAKCREKFVLEKQESDRRFQEMLARSI